MLRTVVFVLGSSLGAAQASAPEHALSQAPVNESAQQTAADDDPEQAADPQAIARANAWIDYCRAISEDLQQSAVPRDWALAALVPKFRIETRGKACGSDSNGLLRRAAQSAPDDVIVQWIAAHAYDTDAHLANAAAQRLKDIEPQNALVWFGDLADAARRSDAGGIDVALGHIASSSRYDEHFAEMLGAVIALFERYPIPDAYWAVVTSEEKRFGREGIAFSSALSIAVDSSLFSLQHLVAACRVDQQTGRNVRHASDCASIGRMMVRQADTALANRIGYALLRVSHTFTDVDERAARRDDWAYSRAPQLMNDDKGDSAGRESLAYASDWLATHSELEAMRRKLLRADIAAEPPPEWSDEDSPFSEKRLRQDAEQLAKDRHTR